METFSSGEKGTIPLIPGKSTIKYSLFLNFTCLLSPVTVTPCQFPVCALPLVNLLKMVDLPAFGLPTK